MTGCSGTITVPPDGEHDAAANIFGVLDASYTDAGGLTAHDQHRLQPRHRQAEHFSAASGVQVAPHAAAEGGNTAGYIDNGDWVSFTPYALGGATRFTARVSSAGPGGTIQVRSGSPSGPLLGSVAVPTTGDWETFTSVSTGLTGVPAATTTLYLVFTGGAGSLFDVDAFTLDSGPVTQPSTRVEAESSTSQSGTQVVADAGAHGGSRVGYVDGGDWLGFAGVDPAGRSGLTARVASGGPGGTIEIRTGSAAGPVLGSVAVPNTGGYGSFVEVPTSLAPGSGPLFLVFQGTGAGGLFDIDDFALTS